jgi:hypothetical protein
MMKTDVPSTWPILSRPAAFKIYYPSGKKFNMEGLLLWVEIPDVGFSPAIKTFKSELVILDPRAIIETEATPEGGAPVMATAYHPRLAEAIGGPEQVNAVLPDWVMPWLDEHPEWE